MHQAVFSFKIGNKIFNVCSWVERRRRRPKLNWTACMVRSPEAENRCNELENSREGSECETDRPAYRPHQKIERPTKKTILNWRWRSCISDHTVLARSDYWSDKFWGFVVNVEWTQRGATLVLTRVRQVEMFSGRRFQIPVIALEQSSANLQVIDAGDVLKLNELFNFVRTEIAFL